MSTKDQDRGREGARTSPRTAAWLAWSLWGLSSALTALSLVPLVLNRSRPEVPVFDYWVEYAWGAVIFSTSGAVIASRRPENRIGWIFCAAGLVGGCTTSAPSTRSTRRSRRLGCSPARHRSLGSPPGPGFRTWPPLIPGVAVPRGSAANTPVAPLRSARRDRMSGRSSSGSAGARFDRRARLRREPCRNRGPRHHRGRDSRLPGASGPGCSGPRHGILHVQAAARRKG